MKRLCAFIAWAALSAGALAQEKSVNPGINKPFVEPNVPEFIEKFEKEGRDVFENREKIVNACGVREGMAIADIGAGTGLFTRLFSPRVGRQGKVYAVDIADEFVSHIEKTAKQQKLDNIAGAVCQPDSVGLPPESIDMAFICDTYHHFEFPQKFMRSIHRALKPRGQVILIDFRRIEGESTEWIMSHVRAGQSVFTKEITEAGFRQIEEKKGLLQESYFVRFEKIDRAPGANAPRSGPTDASESSSGYPRSELLIEPAELAEPDVAKEYIILDARARPLYAQGHIPDARWVDHAAWARSFDHGADVAGWGRRIGGLGISSAARVVVYDDDLSKDAARIWWILRYWGVEDVRLLNAGWHGWKSGKYSTETAAATPTPVEFTARARNERLATKEQLLASLKSGKIQIVDARSEKEFCGIEKMANKRGGAISGAKQLEWADLIDSKTQRFKSAADLRQTFERAGISFDKPTATYCQAGGRAAVMAFGLELMGTAHVSNYYPSWAEWGNADDTPVVPGKPKAAK